MLKVSTLAVLALAAAMPAAAQARQEVWAVDSLTRIGGRPVTVAGRPKVIRWQGGRAVAFDGTNDSLFVKGRPLVGADRFTIEVLIRPDGGEFEQKFLHVAETDPASGLDVRAVGDDHDANNRIMFELRATKDGFYPDGVIVSTAGKAVLATPERLSSLGQWHVVAQSFDGTHYRTYVDGVLQGEVATRFAPQGPGNVRIGARMERLHHFKGAIARIRFTDRALAPADLMRVGSRR
jgi:hypothetical protein